MIGGFLLCLFALASAELQITCPSDIYDMLLSAEDLSIGNTGDATANVAATINSNDEDVNQDDVRKVINRRFTADDGNGNTDFCYQVIIVNDDVDPTFDGGCPADTTVECDSIPDSTLTATDTTGFDSFVKVDLTETNPGGNNPERTITRTWVATDDAGNSATCVQTITVEDTTPPVVQCPADTTISISDDPNDVGSPSGSDPVCWDDVSGSVTFGTPADAQGATTATSFEILRTYTGKDGSNNEASCTQTITVTCTDPDGDEVCNEGDCDANIFGHFVDCNDNCPNDANPLQENFDGDAFGDVCDICPESTDNTDADMDGFGVCDDCDETNPLINPGAEEILDGNGIDENCDGNCDSQIIVTFIKFFAIPNSEKSGRICTPGQDQQQAELDCQEECRYWLLNNGYEDQIGSPEGTCMPNNPDKDTHNECTCYRYDQLPCGA